jgi:N,N'-diacetyllegionaminate synthase
MTLFSSSSFQIAEFIVGNKAPCFIIAEAGVNHNGSLELAKDLVKVASEAGAHAIKFQTFSAEELVTEKAEKATYQKSAVDDQESQFEMLKKLELSYDDHVELVSYCKEKNILFMSTPFDNKSCDLLDNLGVPCFKIGSGDLTNIPLIRYIAKKNKPIILSTGMASLTEIEKALKAIYEISPSFPVALLHCVSCYPTYPEEVNLLAIKTLSAAFSVPVGFSDHTQGIEIPFASIALGAKIIEKHFTLDKNLPGPDHKSSLDPTELKNLINGIKNIEKSFGHGRKEPCKREMETAKIARRSIVANKDIIKDEIITDLNIAIKRPGTGISSDFLPYVIGKKIKKDLKKGDLIIFDDIY